MEVNEEKLKCSLEKLRSCGKLLEEDISNFLRLSVCAFHFCTWLESI